jgi:hypothetical protein
MALWLLMASRMLLMLMLLVLVDADADVAASVGRCWCRQ